MGRRADLLGPQRPASGDSENQSLVERARPAVLDIEEEQAEGRHRALAAGREQEGRAVEQSLPAIVLQHQASGKEPVLARMVVEVRITLSLDQQAQAPDRLRRDS